MIVRVKFWLVLIILSVFGLVLSSFIPKTSGSHISSTGAPGEQTCKQAGCHVDATIVSDSGTNTFVFGNNEQTYLPGQTYQIQLITKRAGVNKFGFQAVAIAEMTETNAGVMLITDSIRTQLQDYASPPLEDRLYVTHTANGTLATSPDSIVWHFDWKAPTTDVGPVVFYYATNCTNQNNQNTGDELHLSEFRITSPTSGIEEWEKDFIVFYDDANHFLHFNHLSKAAWNIALVNIEGQRIANFSLSGKNDYLLPQPLPKGIYFLQMNGNNRQLLKRFIVF
jgi:hypothetical protein